MITSQPAINRRTAELALLWCRRKWGKSRYVKGRPGLRVLKRSRQDLYGWYNERKKREELQKREAMRARLQQLQEEEEPA